MNVVSMFCVQFVAQLKPTLFIKLFKVTFVFCIEDKNSIAKSHNKVRDETTERID